MPVTLGRRRTSSRSRDLAIRSGVVLTVEQIAGGKNPADQYTISAGFKKWQDTDLTTLID